MTVLFCYLLSGSLQSMRSKIVPVHKWALVACLWSKARKLAGSGQNADGLTGHYDLSSLAAEGKFRLARWHKTIWDCNLLSFYRWQFSRWKPGWSAVCLLSMKNTKAEVLTLENILIYMHAHVLRLEGIKKKINQAQSQRLPPWSCTLVACHFPHNDAMIFIGYVIVWPLAR